MKTEFLKAFYKDLDKIDGQNIKDDIESAIKNVEDARTFSDIKGFKKLKGYKIAYRIKIGNFRIGLIIEKNIVEFSRVVHRKDIYKVFP